MELSRSTISDTMPAVLSLHMKVTTSFLILFLGLCCDAARVDGASSLGIFEGETDVGAVGKPGSAHFDAQQQSYTVTGGGENMWFTTDAFHFVWKRVSGKVS